MKIDYSKYIGKRCLIVNPANSSLEGKEGIIKNALVNKNNVQRFHVILDDNVQVNGFPNKKKDFYPVCRNVQILN